MNISHRCRVELLAFAIIFTIILFLSNNPNAMYFTLLVGSTNGRHARRTDETTNGTWISRLHWEDILQKSYRQLPDFLVLHPRWDPEKRWVPRPLCAPSLFLFSNHSSLVVRNCNLYHKTLQ